MAKDKNFLSTTTSSFSAIKLDRKRFLFVQKLFNVMKTHSLFPSSKCIAVGVSGGVDSMGLLYATLLLKKYFPDDIQNIKAIYIHHQTRASQDGEMEMVQEYCLKEGVELTIKKVDWSLIEEKIEEKKVQSNFEHKARSLRYRLFHQFLKDLKEKEDRSYVLYLAHHLDDSFEWSLLKTLKSGKAKSKIGIPLVSGFVARPFLFFKKSEIKDFVLHSNIPFLEDPTNLNFSYERNFLRHQIIPLLSEKFPSYLEHFKSQEEELQSLLLGRKREAKILGLWPKFQPFPVGYVLSFEKVILQKLSAERVLAPYLYIVERVLNSLSSSGRGSTTMELKKLLLEMLISKNKSVEIHTLSGGISALIKENSLFFFSKKALFHYEEIDNIFFTMLKSIVKSGKGDPHLPFSLSLIECSLSELIKFYEETIFDIGEKRVKRDKNKSIVPNFLNEKNILSSLFPYLVISLDRKGHLERVIPSQRREWPLLPLTTRFLKDSKIWYRSIDEIKRWIKKEENKGLKVDRSSSVIGKHLKTKFAFVKFSV